MNGSARTRRNLTAKPPAPAPGNPTATATSSDNHNCTVTLPQAPSSTQVVLASFATSLNGASLTSVSGMGGTWVRLLANARLELWAGYGFTGGAAFTGYSSNAAYIVCTAVIFDGLASPVVSLGSVAGTNYGSGTTIDTGTLTLATSNGKGFVAFAGCSNDAGHLTSFSDTPRPFTEMPRVNYPSPTYENNDSGYLVCTPADVGAALRRVGTALSVSQACGGIVAVQGAA